VGKVILRNGRLKWFEVSDAKIYSVNVTTMALAKRRAEFTIIAVVTIKINYRNGLGIVGNIP
tara:strand:+ start:8337 stop:8522 length:186 start_codon:yes stop_codon:yes gene_type:complete